MILAINPFRPITYQKNKYTPKFTSAESAYTVLTPEGEKLISNFTKIFRCDLNWNNLATFLGEHFQGAKKVNVMSIASSDGSEAYSLAISLKKMLGEKSEKFFPILASDQDSNIINMAKTRKINLSLEDRRVVNMLTGGFFNDLFTKVEDVNIENKMHDVGYHTYEPIKDLQKAVKFKQAKINKQLSELKDNGNSFILCRNVFPYFEYHDLWKTMVLLQKKLKNGSVLAVGDYDENACIQESLASCGFRHVMRNIFVRQTNY